MRKGTPAKILQLLKPQAGWIVLTLVLAVIYVAGSLYAPMLSGRAVDLIVGEGDVDFPGLAAIGLRIGITVGITALAQWLMGLVNQRITYRTVCRLRSIAFRKLETLPASYLDTHRPGDTISRFTNDTETFSDGLLMGFTQLFTGVLTIIVTLVLLFSISWQIALAVLVLTPISMFAARFIAGRTFSLFLDQSKKRAQMTSFVDEYVGNARSVRAFGCADRADETFDTINDELTDVGIRATFYSSLANPTTRFVNAIVYAVVGILGAFLVINGPVTVGQLVVALSYANQYTKPFNDISTVMTEMQNALACAERVFEFAEEEPEPADAEDAVLLGAVAAAAGDAVPVAAGDAKSPAADSAGIEFRNVYFGYEPDRPVIRGLNFSMSPGEHIALVGRTGCGKTTLMNLLLRFYDPDEGQILIDGYATTDITRGSLREHFGMVLQDTWLKEGTVAENIAYGKPHAARAEIVEAAKRARADSFIRRLPQGYDTLIGEDGGSLSAGQKQLLCIARAMLKDAPVLILDEATSSIDTRTEVLVQEAFDELMKGRSSLVVAHRLSTIVNSDRILVMDAGTIEEEGSHEELLLKKGLYADLYESQFAGQKT